MRTTLAPALLTAALLSSGTPATAAELEGVQVADEVALGADTLVLNGLGLRKKFVFKVYVGALYLPEESDQPDAILAADTLRQTDMFFLRKVGAGQLCGAWSDCLEGNAPGASGELRGLFDRLCEQMEDVRKGDRMTVVYRPQEGTKVAFGDGAKDPIPGKDFADTLFACWIGDQPATEELKRGMLGG